ncbi:MAG: proton-conducting transporter membrane subunit [Terriglobales bacterium]
MTMTTLIPMPVAMPLLMAAFIALSGEWIGRRASDALAIATATASGIITVIILRGVWLQPQVYWFGNWWPRSGGVVLGICFTVDAIGAALAVLTALLTTAGLVYSWRIFESNENHFQPLMLIFMAAMCGFTYSGDLFNLFVFFELMSVSAFALCGLKTLEPAPLQGAYNFAVVNTVGAFMIIIGIALLYARTGALNFAQIGASLGAHADALILLAFLMISVGYMVKAAIVPFHFWLADAHAVAPSPVCVLFSGVMVELGIYAVARVYWTMFHETLVAHSYQLRGIFLVVAAITAVIGGLMCYAEHHLKRMLAFSTIAHAGLMLAGFALLTPKALAGLVIYALSHGFIKGGLFLSAGIVLHRLQQIGEDHLHGRGRGMWFTAALFILGACGLAGIVPFGTLLGESMISDAAKEVHQGWLAYLFQFVEIITAAAVLRFTCRVFLGWGDSAPTDKASRVEELPETDKQHENTPPTMFLPAAFLIVMGIAMTTIPQLRSTAAAAAHLFTNESANARMVLDNAEPAAPSLPQQPALMSSVIRSGIAAMLALLLALGTVFRERFAIVLDFTGRLERGNSLLRKLQSGHSGDYVAWLTLGAAMLGGLFVIFLR